MHHDGSPWHTDKLRDHFPIALSKSSRAIKIDEKANDPFKIVCDCGPVVQGTDLRIVDQSGNKLGDGEIGHILVRGPSIATYHHEFAAQSDTVAKDGWLRTGDLGYLRNTRLFVTGRSKDVVIVRGNNYDPVDFEQAAEEIPEVRKGRVVAFAVFSQDAGTEELIVWPNYLEDQFGISQRLRP